MFIPKNTTLILFKLRMLMELYSDLGDIGPAGTVGAGLDAYIVPSADAHHNIRISECDQRRAYVSGFDGSAGTAIITDAEALLWTDGRYYTQAGQQLDENWTLMKDGLPDTPSQTEWLITSLPTNSTVGVDGQQYSKSEWDQMSSALLEHGIYLVAVESNLVDQVWTNRPNCTRNPVVQLSLEFTGRFPKDKIEDVRKDMRDQGVDVLVISELDEVAWLLNLRGSDLPLAPTFFSYVILGIVDEIEFFVDSEQLSEKIRVDLREQIPTIQIYEYTDVFSVLSKKVSRGPGRFWLSKNCNYALARLVPMERLLMKLTPISLFKAIKNPVEVAGMRQAFVKDSAAVITFYAWLENVIKSGLELTEISAANQLYHYRSKVENFVSLSFKTISGSGPNGAIIHYWPTNDTDRSLSVHEMYLVDSGAHYLDGTTDHTRTFHFGQPTDHEKDCFTRVLKGQIAISRLKFPVGAPGHTIDPFARQFLWDVGLDYAHGTGHGIGAYLNVGEGPYGIFRGVNPDDPGLRENMIVSNEPGYYEENNFGIRLENAVRVRKSDFSSNFLEMEDLTFVPYQRNLIKVELLAVHEIQYLNSYFNKCREITGKYLLDHPMDQGEAYAWLLRETEPLQKTTTS